MLKDSTGEFSAFK